MASPRTETGAPAAKVVGGTMGAAVATLFIWGLSVAGLPVDESIKVALTTVITFIVGYMIPPAPRDNVVSGRRTRPTLNRPVRAAIAGAVGHIFPPTKNGGGISGRPQRKIVAGVASNSPRNLRRMDEHLTQRSSDF